MLLYVKLGKTRGLSIEFVKDFGRKPLFQKKYFHREIIIDIPYSQFVFTPSNWNSKKLNSLRKKENGNNKTGQIPKCVSGTH